MLNINKHLLLFLLFAVVGSLSAQKYDTTYQIRYVTETITKDSILTNDILFATDRYELSGPEMLKLNETIRKILNHKDYQIDLVGFADFRGSDEHNIELSTNRVNTVYEYIGARQLDKSKMRKVAVGEVPATRDVVDLDKDLQPYRHVTVRATVYYQETRQKEIKEKVLIMTCRESDTLIHFSNGSTLFVEGCSFSCHKLEDLKFKLELEVTRADMLTNNLPTLTSNGECLRTAGMLFFSATDRDDNPVESDRPMTLRVPGNLIEGKVELFDAVRNVYTSEVDSWAPADNELTSEREGAQTFYSFTVTASVSKNMDVRTGIFARPDDNPSPHFKMRIFKERNSEVFLSGYQTNLRADFFKKRKFYFKAADCIPVDQQMVTVFVKKKNGKEFLYHRPLGELIRQDRWFIGRGDRFLVRKRDFLKLPIHESVFDLITASR